MQSSNRGVKNIHKKCNFLLTHFFNDFTLSIQTVLKITVLDYCHIHAICQLNYVLNHPIYSQKNRDICSEFEFLTSQEICKIHIFISFLP